MQVDIEEIDMRKIVEPLIFFCIKRVSSARNYGD